jgi:hypothetical protein
MAGRLVLLDTGMMMVTVSTWPSTTSTSCSSTILSMILSYHVSSVRVTRLRASLPLTQRAQYHINTTARTPVLPSWDLAQFRERAFTPALPHLLPAQRDAIPRACAEWFVHAVNPEAGSNRSVPPQTLELRTSYWQQYDSTLVPLELTTNDTHTPSGLAFHRANAPLKILLDHLKPAIEAGKLSSSNQSIYLAQCPLPSLPQPLLDALPTPDLVQAGRGDVYGSSLWLGRPPTYTPLHRDPNPNLFFQLAGQKIVLLLPPEVGEAIYEAVQDAIPGSSSRAAIRGEEMMVGAERRLLEDGIWGKGETTQPVVREVNTAVARFGQLAELDMGNALFIPQGWWHSVRGVGRGITASANWWFR